MTEIVLNDGDEERGEVDRIVHAPGCVRARPVEGVIGRHGFVEAGAAWTCAPDCPVKGEADGE